MSLQGDLKEFPITDIIQLLNGSRKSGVLRLYRGKLESQLVFHEGDLVSANYLNNRVRIGQVLVSNGAITEKQLTQALDIQKNAGSDRKPLVITLLEHNMVDEATAYNSLESLIEMTVIDVLTWKEGRFSLETAAGESVDGYHYHFSKANFSQQILLNAQGILMESLRIYDEKVRDGSMDEILSIAGISNQDLDAELPGNSAPAMQAGGYAGDASSTLPRLLDEQRSMKRSAGDQSYRTVDALKKLIIEEFPLVPNEQKTQLLALLLGSETESASSEEFRELAVIVITQSALLSTVVRSICHQQGIYAVSADNVATVDINIRLLLCQALHLVVLLDIPHDDSAARDMLRFCADLKNYPQSTVVLVACSRVWSALGLRGLSLGVHSIIPRPCRECAQDSFPQQVITLCADLGGFLRNLSLEHGSGPDQRFFACISKLRGCKTRMEIAIAILDYLIEDFDRAIVFLVTASELVAEQAFGVNQEKTEGLAHLSQVRVTADDQEIFENVIKNGQMYYGFHSDSTWPHQLYRQIGRPDSPEVLLFPFVRANMVVAFIYADFGSKHAAPPSLYHLEALQHYTTAQISVSAYRQKLKSMTEAARNAGCESIFQS